jgi:hypothetical protein
VLLFVPVTVTLPVPPAGAAAIATLTTVDAPTASVVDVGETPQLAVSPAPEQLALSVIGAETDPVFAMSNVALPGCPAVTCTVPPLGLIATCGGGKVVDTARVPLHDDPPALAVSVAEPLPPTEPFTATLTVTAPPGAMFTDWTSGPQTDASSPAPVHDAEKVTAAATTPVFWIVNGVEVCCHAAIVSVPPAGVTASCGGGAGFVKL